VDGNRDPPVLTQGKDHLQPWNEQQEHCCPWGSARLSRERSTGYQSSETSRGQAGLHKELVLASFKDS
jgi:hypothetical protein